MNRVQRALRRAGLSYAAIARELGVSKPSVVNLVLRGHAPRGREAELRLGIDRLLAGAGIYERDLWAAPLPREGSEDEQHHDEEIKMRVQLSQEARQQYGLPRDPWEVRRASDVWLGKRWRYAAMAIEDAAQTGGFLALIGESGCGKSTLRRYVLDQIRRHDRPVRAVEPITVDRSRLTAAAICHAILDDLAPEEQPRRTLEYLTRQARRVLTESARTGCSHVLIIEEAHDLNVSTLKYLKRIWEFEIDGFNRLVSIVLLGQPELGALLDSRSWAVREVVRRCEVVEVGALDHPGELEDFLGARIGREHFEDGAMEAIRERLSRRTREGVVSTAWPLAVANLVTSALNLSVELGLPQVTAAVIEAA